MKISVVFLVLVTIVMQAFAHPEDTYYLRGEIEGREVAMVLDQFGDVCMARYFDKADKYDHFLEGSIISNKEFKLMANSWETSGNKKVAGEKLHLRQVEGHLWRGVWINKQGKADTILLRPIDTKALKHPFADAVRVGRINPYDAYRTKDVKLTKRDKETLVNGVKVRWYEDKKTGIRMFRVLAKNDGMPEVDSINNQLIAMHLQAVNGKYSCVNFKGHGAYNYTSKIHFLNTRFISLQQTTTSDCYGVGESAGVSDFTFSIATGKKVILEDIIWLGATVKPEIRNGSQEWFQYRYKVFGIKVAGLLTELYPEQMKPSTERECTYNSPKIWQFPTWYLTFDGLYLGSKDVSKSKCDKAEWSVIPWDNLKPYLVNDIIL